MEKKAKRIKRMTKHRLLTETRRKKTKRKIRTKRGSKPNQTVNYNRTPPTPKRSQEHLCQRSSDTTQTENKIIIY